MSALAIVLHAHLPYVRDDEHPHSRHERWLHEALWECYLPLLDLVGGLVRDDIAAPITLSVSPTLASMLCDAILKKRFEAHLDAVSELNDRQRGGAFASAAEHHAERLARARDTWVKTRGDVLGALAKLHRDGALELMTTAASHAYLPALGASAVRAQLALGLSSFAELAHIEPCGMWLPECAIDARIEAILESLSIDHTVVDEHAGRAERSEVLESPRGIACFTRDREACLRVWSRASGYPGHASYREFHRDLVHVSDVGALRGGMTGLKYWRITSRESEDKEPYDAAEALARADRDADDYLAWLADRAPLTVLAFDAELFGHWWFEGPRFLERVLRAAHVVTLASWRGDALSPRAPGASSWGRGGYADPWVGDRNAALWRHVHHTHRLVETLVRAEPMLGGLRGLALDQAIRELILLESSDWAFMLDLDSEAAYARARFAWHRARALRFLAIAAGEASPAEPEARLLREPSGFLRELAGERLRSALS
ncbi:MAG TPA: 1,4-alpha-glucan branching protein domain-containing protein [Polyangiaceae bacterium]|nr:1,4-alpha-glucan branching protein domain-containing protein [Polyangiaceae bacterium]